MQPWSDFLNGHKNTLSEVNAVSSLLFAQKVIGRVEQTLQRQPLAEKVV